MSHTRIQVVVADITTLSVDAVVNAANETLLGGGGVDGAIHRAAGTGLLAECEGLGGCPTGSAKITRGYDLPARHIIHTVGPVWPHGLGDGGEPPGVYKQDTLLASCYDESLRLAETYSISSIAYPAISTGVYRFPKVRAAIIAVSRVMSWLSDHTYPENVTFCCFSEADTGYYHQALSDFGRG